MQSQSQLLLFLLLKAHSLLLFLQLTNAAHIYPGSRIVVQEGQGFQVKLATDPGFGPVKYCTFLFNSQPYFLHPTNENEVAYVSIHGETVQRFTMSDCGAQVSNVSLNSAGTWHLGATSSTGVDASAEFSLEIAPLTRSDIESTTISGRPGTVVEIKCAPQDTDDHRFCEMWVEGEGEAVKREECTWTTMFPELLQRREVRCLTFAKGSMEAVTKKWTVVGEYSDTTSDYLNGDSSVVLRCKRKSSPLLGCYIRNRQTGHIHRIANGLKGHRYSSFRSNLARGLCQFEIPKPIRVDELGQWLLRMYYGDSGGSVDECLFTVTDGNVFQV